MHPINEFGTDAQKEMYLPRLGKTSYLLCTCPYRDVAPAKAELVGAFVSLTADDTPSMPNAFLRVSLNPTTVLTQPGWKPRQKRSMVGILSMGAKHGYPMPRWREHSSTFTSYINLYRSLFLQRRLYHLGKLQMG